MVDKNNEHTQAIAGYVTKEGLNYFGSEFTYTETGETFTVTVANESALRKFTEENARLREALSDLIDGYSAYDLVDSTGCSLGRCKEIVALLKVTSDE